MPAEHQLQPGYAMIVVGFGSPEEHAEVLDRARAGVPPLVEFASPMPYVELQKMLDEANAWGVYAYDKGCYVEELSDAVIDTLVEHFPQKTSPMSIVLFYRLDGASQPGARGRHGVQRRPLASVRDVHHRHHAGPGDVRGRARVGAVGRRGVPAPRGQGRVVRERLGRVRRPRPGAGGVRLPRSSRDWCEIKAKYDPANMFHSTADIAPVR